MKEENAFNRIANRVSQETKTKVTRDLDIIEAKEILLKHHHKVFNRYQKIDEIYPEGKLKLIVDAMLEFTHLKANQMVGNQKKVKYLVDQHKGIEGYIYVADHPKFENIVVLMNNESQAIITLYKEVWRKLPMTRIKALNELENQLGKQLKKVAQEKNKMINSL